MTSKVESLISEFPAVFADGLGTYTGPPARLVVPETAQPTFCKARSVPYALKDKVCEELQRLESEGIIEPVEHSEWAAPIVPVVKEDGSLRICGDYKLAVNRQACTYSSFFFFPCKLR